MSCKSSTPALILHVVFVFALLACLSCQSETGGNHEDRSEKSKEKSQNSGRLNAENGKNTSEQNGGNDDAQPTAWLKKDDAKIPVRGAVVYQSGQLLRFFLSSKPLTCVTDDDARRIPLDVVSRLQPEGPPGWRVHDRSAQRPLNDPAGDPPVRDLTLEDSTVTLELDPTPIKHVNHGLFTLSGRVEAQRCPGGIPGQGHTSSAAAKGNLQIEVGDQSLPVRGAILSNQHGNRFAITLSPTPLDCKQADRLQGVLIDLFYTSLERSPSGLSLHGERVRGHHNGVGNTLQSVQTPGKDGVYLQIGGTARVGPFSLSFSGDGIQVQDCREAQ